MSSRRLHEAGDCWAPCIWCHYDDDYERTREEDVDGDD